MRKFSARWWSGDDLLQWRFMTECGQYEEPFFWWPRIPVSVFTMDWTTFGGLPVATTSRVMTRAEFRARYPIPPTSVKILP